MKYIVIIGTANKLGIEREFPFIFPDSLVHSEVAKSMLQLLSCDGMHNNLKVVSAGFLSSTGIASSCNGKSESIGVASRGVVDSQLIRGMDYFHGII